MLSINRPCAFIVSDLFVNKLLSYKAFCITRGQKDTKAQGNEDTSRRGHKDTRKLGNTGIMSEGHEDTRRRGHEDTRSVECGGVSGEPGLQQVDKSGD